MKTLLILAALAASGSAQANALSQINCHSEDVIDGGYAFRLNDDFRSAELVEQTIAGPKPLTQMECARIPSQGYPDEIVNTALCRGREKSEVIVRLFEGGLAYQRYAEVHSLDNNGDEQIVQFGKLSCLR